MYCWQKSTLPKIYCWQNIFLLKFIADKNPESSIFPVWWVSSLLSYANESESRYPASFIGEWGPKPSNPSLLDKYEARALEVPSILCSIFRSLPCLSYECFQLNGPTLCCFASVITWSTVFSVFSQHIQLRFLLGIQFWKCISLISKRYFCSSYSKPFKVLYKLFSN